MKNYNPREISPVEVVFNLIGGKFKAAIIWYLSDEGVLRFGELSRRINHASPKVLTSQLREMEADGLIVRNLVCQKPLWVEYSLTSLGSSLSPFVLELHKWGIDYVRSLPRTEAPITENARWCYAVIDSGRSRYKAKK